MSLTGTDPQDLDDRETGDDLDDQLASLLVAGGPTCRCAPGDPHHECGLHWTRAPGFWPGVAGTEAAPF